MDKLNEQKLKDSISTIRSLEDLENELGELTPEEKTLLEKVDLVSEPTEEELQFIGKDFTEKLVERTIKNIHKFE